MLILGSDPPAVPLVVDQWGLWHPLTLRGELFGLQGGQFTVGIELESVVDRITIGIAGGVDGKGGLKGGHPGAVSGVLKGRGAGGVV